MSKPDFLERLLDGAGVEWKALGEVAEIYGGLTGKSKADFEDGNASYISYKNIFENIDVDFEKLESVNVSSSEKQHTVKYGDVLFTGSSENAEEVGMSSAVTTRCENYVYLNSFSFGVRFNEGICLTPEFSKYLFRSHSIRKQIVKTANGVTRFNISKVQFKKLLIPIPCPENPEKSLRIQREIVRILDKFTELKVELTAQLKAELTARKKQYEYYSNKLLTFDDVEWRALGDVFEVFAGGDVPKKSLSKIKTEEFNIPILSNGTENKSLYGWTNKSKINKPSLTISARGTIGWTSYRDYPFFPIVRLLVITPKIDINLKYTYYFMKTIENNYKVPATGIPQLTKPMVKDIQIPIPPLAEQARIVSILDKFDTLVNSISEGLPREIELRQKQYEYYRDYLLSFGARRHTV